MEPHLKTMRPRRVVSPLTVWLLHPLFRHSATRNAWILRAMGARRGPVLVRRGTEPKVENVPEGWSDAGPERGGTGP